MVRVQLWGSLRHTADAPETVEVEARNVREMLDALRRSHPGLGPQLDRGVSVSIDGLVYRDAWLTPVGPENEIVLLPRLTGG